MITLVNYYYSGTTDTYRDQLMKDKLPEPLNSDAMKFLSEITNEELIELDDKYYDVLSEAFGSNDKSLEYSAFYLQSRVNFEIKRRFIAEHTNNLTEA